MLVGNVHRVSMSVWGVRLVTPLQLETGIRVKVGKQFLKKSADPFGVIRRVRLVSVLSAPPVVLPWDLDFLLSGGGPPPRLHPRP